MLSVSVTLCAPILTVSEQCSMESGLWGSMDLRSRKLRFLSLDPVASSVPFCKKLLPWILIMHSLSHTVWLEVSTAWSQDWQEAYKYLHEVHSIDASKATTGKVEVGGGLLMLCPSAPLILSADTCLLPVKLLFIHWNAIHTFRVFIVGYSTS